MDTTEREELDTEIEPSDLMTPHLDDFLAELEPSTPEDEVSKIMNSLLDRRLPASYPGSLGSGHRCRHRYSGPALLGRSLRQLLR